MTTSIVWKADWSEDDHPRGPGGQFAGGGFTSSEWEQPAPDTRVNYDERGNRYELKGDPGLLDNANLRFGGNDQLSVEVTNKDGERIAQVTAHYDYGDRNVPGPVIKIWKYEVDESLRGQGLARRMVEAMHDNVMMLGDKAMVLHSGFVSTEGQHFAETMNPKWNRVMGSDENKWRKPNAYVKKQVIYKAEWSEDDHPRDEHGRFGEGGSAHEPEAFQTLPNSQTTKALKEAAAWTGANCTGFVPSMVEAPIVPEAVDGVSKGVTDYQLDVLQEYTDSSYESTNSMLRDGSGTVDSDRVCGAMQDAIDNNTITENVVVFRGTMDDALTAQILSMAPGETFTDKAFVSTSLVKSKGEGFAGSDGMVFQMAVPKGSHAVGLVGGEGELLLGANSKFRLESIDTSSKIPVAKITYVGADPHMTGTFKKAKRGDIKGAGKFGWTADCITIERKPSKAKKSTQIIWKSVGFGHETIMWKEWNEDAHPRDEHGRFGDGGEERTKEALATLESMGITLGDHVNPNAAAFVAEMGIDKATAEKAGQAIADALKDATPVVMVSPEALFSIIEDGRFKSQFESDTSRGVLNPVLRMDTERNLFGYQYSVLDMPYELRPIYGTVAFSNPAASLDSEPSLRNAEDYGEIRVVLKDSVSDRTTFTVNDSLTPEKGNATPALLGETDPAKCFAALSGTDGADYAAEQVKDSESQSPQDRVMSMSGDRYVETQIHGGVTVADIAYIVIPKGYQLFGISRVKESGIEVRTSQ